MSRWSRIANVFRSGAVSRRVDEELESHLKEAVADGRDADEARRAFGSPLRHREASRDLRLLPWLDSLRADAVFGWRQLKKRKGTSAAAILSLALGIGACASAFQLIYAVLLRPLPVAHADRLYAVSREGTEPDGTVGRADGWAYPAFERMRAAVKDRAALLAVSYADRTDLTYRPDQPPEKAYVQYVSGAMFGCFGLQPAVGRLLTQNDDREPGAHPYAVLSYDYWKRRFGRDPKAVGTTFRMGGDLYQIVGVVAAPFTGTQPGTITDVFVPTMMNQGAVHDDWTWHRTLAVLKPGVAAEPVRAMLDAVSRAFEEERTKGFMGMSKETIAQILSIKVVLDPAAGGASSLQEDYRPALLVLGALVLLVLLIACANVANLMTSQAAAREREIALRVSIGAGRARVVQLVLVESAMIAFLAAAMGAVFAWWSAPFVVSRINPPDNPARLALTADWRVVGFGLALTLAVTLLFGLAPALRAAAIQPASALKGGTDPHTRRRSMHLLIALQAAFCFVVIFLAGLFAATFDRLSNRPMGFSAARLLNIEAEVEHAEPPVLWEQVADHLRTVPGVESVAIAGWPLLSGQDWNRFISVNGAPPGPVLAHFLAVSPGWLEVMKIPLREGRDFRAGDRYPGAVIVNEAFVKQFLNGGRALGVSINNREYAPDVVVGVVPDSPYRDIRESNLPVAYVPFHGLDEKGVVQPVQFGTFLVRTTGAKPMALASILRKEVPRARAEFRVTDIRSQQEIDDAHTVRERLLAMLALFFAAVALLLAGVGLYGVLDYSVVRRRREIGIRMAIGAQPGRIARLVTTEIFAMVVVGAAAGLALGMMSVKYIRTLLYQVQSTDASMLAGPALIILAAAVVAALPAVLRAVRTDPAATLRAE